MIPLPDEEEQDGSETPLPESVHLETSRRSVKKEEWYTDDAKKIAEAYAIVEATVGKGERAETV
jgi:hypothetical protein